VCGDCTDALVVEKALAGAIAVHVFTDPPYRFETRGAGCFGPAHDKEGHSIRKTMNAIDDAGIADFDPTAFLALLPSWFTQGTVSAFVFCSKDLLPDYLNWAVANGVSFNVLVWHKTGGVVPFGNGPVPDVEYLLLLRKAAKWVAGTTANRSKVLSYGRADAGDHPTPQPLDLVSNQLQLTSEKGDIVADPFLGSGTTLIACEQLGRTCYGIELSPAYCDVVCQRYQRMTNKPAILEATGQTFDELAATGR
jgi:hypothetical protein